MIISHMPLGPTLYLGIKGAILRLFYLLQKKNCYFLKMFIIFKYFIKYILTLKGMI